MPWFNLVTYQTDLGSVSLSNAFKDDVRQTPGYNAFKDFQNKKIKKVGIKLRL